MGTAKVCLALMGACVLRWAIAGRVDTEFLIAFIFFAVLGAYSWGEAEASKRKRKEDRPPY